MDPYPDVSESCGSAVSPISKVRKKHILYEWVYSFSGYPTNFKDFEVFLAACIEAVKAF
jgi:hypothetical protein